MRGLIFVLDRFFFRFVFCIDFWSLFGAILVPFWGVLGRLWEGQMGNFWHRFSHAIPRVRVHVRVGCARPCGCVLGAAQSGPGAPKSGPRAAKSGPRAVLGRSWDGLGRCWVVLLALLAALGSLLGRSSVHKCCALPVLAGEGLERAAREHRRPLAGISRVQAVSANC